MVLQPAVEAFFMVHASASEKESEKKETKQEMLAHIEQIAPLPETHSDEKEDESSTEQNKFKNMPQNTIKFLQFAEKHKVFITSFISLFKPFRLYWTKFYDSQAPRWWMVHFQFWPNTSDC